MPGPTESSIRKHIEARESTLGDVILQLNRRFTIPLNQRPWAWSHPSRIHDLLTDFDNTIKKHYDGSLTPRWSTPLEHPGPPHFFGTFVFFQREDNFFEIFDGQQRITALSMLCAVFAEAAYHLEHSADAASSSTLAGLSGAFRQWLLVSPPDTTNPKLSPDPRFHNLFDALIFGCVTESERNQKLDNLSHDIKTNRTTKLLRKSFSQIQTHINSKMVGYTDEEKIAYLKAAKYVLQHQFVCVETTIKEEPYAFEVFECLNARGVSLSEADKIKNELFKSSKKADHHGISDDWSEICNNIRNQEVGEFLRRRHIALYGACRQNQTFQTIKHHDIDPSQDLGALVGQWRDDSNFHSSLELRDATLFNDQTRMHLKVIFEVLGVGLAVIPLLAAGKAFWPAEKDKFQQCASLIENFVFRQLTITGIKTSELESQLGEASRVFGVGNELSLFESVLKKYTNDGRFRDKFESYATSRSKIQYYILRRIETQLLGGSKGLVPGDHDEFGNNLEHILPQRVSQAASRSGEWQWARQDPALHKNLVNKLGNLLILESTINQDVSNYSFNAKQKGFTRRVRGVEHRHEGYCDSQLYWPKRLADDAVWTDWTEREIVMRQKELADVALKVWSI